jgi:hypothetical protein
MILMLFWVFVSVVLFGAFTCHGELRYSLHTPKGTLLLVVQDSKTETIGSARLIGYLENQTAHTLQNIRVSTTATDKNGHGLSLCGRVPSCVLERDAPVAPGARAKLRDADGDLFYGGQYRWSRKPQRESLMLFGSLRPPTCRHARL